jgi:hypothetical protein
MATTIPGIDPILAAQYDERQWRLLTHPRSLALGSYRRGVDDTFTAPIPLHQHHRTVQKGFVLVEVIDAHMGLSGPWVAEVA